MKNVEMKKYGAILTGREFGKTITERVFKTFPPPVTFDFSGVISMGSSFGDELIPFYSEKQDKKIYVKNVNESIQECLRDIKDEYQILIEYKD